MTGEVAPAVWLYWETRPGRTRPGYLDLCLETIRRHTPPLELRCVGPDDVVTWLPDLDVDRWYALPAPNYRSDYARSRLLAHHGGVWVDIDTIALSPLSQLTEAVDDAGTVCFGKELGRFYGGLSAARAGAPFVCAWAEEQDKALSRQVDWSTLGYAALAQDITWHLARREPWTSLPLEKVAPVPWEQWRRFFSSVESPARILAPAPITVVLWNAVMGRRLRPLPAEDVLRRRWLVSRLLRIGLDATEPPDEEDVLTHFDALSALRFSRRGQRLELGLRQLLDRRHR